MNKGAHNSGNWRRDEWRDPLSGQLIAIEVVPLNDLRPHRSSEQCDCIPDYLSANHPPMLIHNSFDAREYAESNNTKLKGN